MNVFEELYWRGIIENYTPGIENILSKRKISVYIGFDPTAKSLHIGSLLPIISLVWIEKYGHRPIIVIGGGTGLIGDPSGKNKERPLLTKEEVINNSNSIKTQLEKILNLNDRQILILNNIDWLYNLNLLNFLRDIGKHISLNYMLSKENVRNRLAKEDGISFTEFTYMLLQAYDFLYLFDNYNCILQMGGSDQWGNITTGIKLIEKIRGKQAFGIVTPLLKDSSGRKFGKTENGETIWLNSKLTSPYKFYQFWLNIDDRDIIKCLKYFTFLSKEELEELEKKLNSDEDKNNLKRLLAEEITKFVHGELELMKAKKASKILFGKVIDNNINLNELLEIFNDVPNIEIDKKIIYEEIDIIDFLYKIGVVKSKSESIRIIKSGGVYIQNKRVDINKKITKNETIQEKFIILRIGKKNYFLIKLI